MCVCVCEILYIGMNREEYYGGLDIFRMKKMISRSFYCTYRMCCKDAVISHICTSLSHSLMVEGATKEEKKEKKTCKIIIEIIF